MKKVLALLLVVCMLLSLAEIGRASVGKECLE